MAFTAEQNDDGEQLEGEEQAKPSDRNPSDQNDDDDDDIEEWEIMTLAWLSSFPEGRAGSMEEVEAWVDSNRGNLPAKIRSLSRSVICQRLMSIRHLTTFSTQGKEEEIQGDSGDQDEQGDLPHGRFRRSDQWLPVYSWLETLQQDEVVKSDKISDWLAENPSIRNQLCSKHSRCYVMKYIKTCHLKILKRKLYKKDSQLPEKSPLKVHKDVLMKPALPTRDSLGDLPKESDAYLEKRKEALRKYEILVELEKFLAPHFSKPRTQIGTSTISGNGI